MTSLKTFSLQYLGQTFIETSIGNFCFCVFLGFGSGPDVSQLVNFFVFSPACVLDIANMSSS